ncbi:NAD(P)HX epimerase isoform X2 [Brevipalpus obovatus]
MEGIKCLSQEEAIRLDQDLFNECQFSVDQLMELAGLSVASSVIKSYPSNSYKTIAVCCGPGNNGGDGLVAARHLLAFGYEPTIYYPKPGKSELYNRLVKQCKDNGIHFLDSIDGIDHNSLIVDAVFGFSYKPPCRPEFVELLKLMSRCNNRLISVDIPSGWHVESGPPNDGTPILKPGCLISLTAPKLCSKFFTGQHHYLGGRFVPKTIKEKYGLRLPEYFASEQCVKIV